MSREQDKPRLPRWKGGVPWSREGLLEAMGQVDEFRAAGVQKPMIEVIVWLRERYGLDTGLAHGDRLLKVIMFMKQHQQRLLNEGLVGSGVDDGLRGGRALLEVLATAQYTRRVAKDDAPDGWDYTFDPDEIVRAVRDR